MPDHRGRWNGVDHLQFIGHVNHNPIDVVPLIACERFLEICDYRDHDPLLVIVQY